MQNKYTLLSYYNGKSWIYPLLFHNMIRNPSIFGCNVPVRDGSQYPGVITWRAKTASRGSRTSYRQTCVHRRPMSHTRSVLFRCKTSLACVTLGQSGILFEANDPLLAYPSSEVLARWLLSSSCRCEFVCLVSLSYLLPLPSAYCNSFFIPFSTKCSPCMKLTSFFCCILKLFRCGCIFEKIKMCILIHIPTSVSITSYYR